VSKIIKQMELDAMKKTFSGLRDLVMMKVVGLNAIADNQMRLGLRKKGIHLQMVKNSLARRVFTDMGLSVDAGWEGSTTVAWGGTSRPRNTIRSGPQDAHARGSDWAHYQFGAGSGQPPGWADPRPGIIGGQPDQNAERKERGSSGGQRMNGWRLFLGHGVGVLDSDWK
jgi:hypothetical protein